MGTELRVLCRIAWNGWPDNEVCRSVAKNEIRDSNSAAAWDRVIETILKSAPEMDASHNSGERGASVMPDLAGADAALQWVFFDLIEAIESELDCDNRSTAFRTRLMNAKVAIRRFREIQTGVARGMEFPNQELPIALSGGK